MPNRELLDAAWLAYREEADQGALDFLVRSYAPLAGYLAQRALAKAPEHQEPEEIIAFAQDGLLDALRKFDPSVGVKFETYATRRIAGEIVDGLRRKDPLGRVLRRQVKSVEAGVTGFWAEHHRAPTVSELAEQVGISELDVREALLAQQTTNDSIDNPAHENRFANESDAEASSQLAEIAAVMSHRLAMMPAHQRAVVLAYYCANLNLKMTAEALHMSAGRARRIRTDVWTHVTGR
jgi:RNA polymerase sigma factor for flagellar operon FliA